MFAAFLDGARYQRHPGKVAWLDTIDRAQAAGCWMGRVHVVTEPLSDYMRFELTWGYQPNVTAGEDIHILPVAEGESWPDLPRYDYWLFDSCELYRMHYADDDAGTWLGVEHVINPAEVVQAGAWRDIAWHHAIPWRDYVRVHPELVEHLPAG